MKKKPSAILITGAAKRLGLALTKKSLSLGYSVVAHYRSSAAPLQRWLARHRQYKNNIFLLKHNLSECPERLIDMTLGLPVSLVGLVNNAAVFTEGDLRDYTHFRDCIRINTCAPLVLAQRFQEKVRRGWIINVTDACCVPLNTSFQNYRITKMFLNELTRQMAFAFGPGIRVNALAPGAILPRTEKDAALFRRIKERVPLGKEADSESLLAAYAFLVNASSITGQIIYVDCGLHLLA